jgi:hypothetical protein
VGDLDGHRFLQVHHYSWLTSIFGLFLSFLNLLATLTHVFRILRAGSCVVRRNKAAAIGGGICL